MSEIGRIYARYQESLEWGLEHFDRQRRRSLEEVKRLYPSFLSKLVRNYGSYWKSRERRKSILRRLRECFGGGSPEFPFAAIDGTGNKRELSDMMVFYGAAYAQTGDLTIRKSEETIRYRRWQPSEDTSFVAYLPVPLNALSELHGEDWLFQADDKERTTIASVHTQLMQLAEIYLAYLYLKKDNPPKILLFDHNLSSIFLSTDVMHRVHTYKLDRTPLGWIGAYIPLWGREFEPLDALVAHAHPMNREMDVPSKRSNALMERIVAEMTGFWCIGRPKEREPDRDIIVRADDYANVTADNLYERLRNRIKDFPYFSVERVANGILVRPNLRDRQPTLRQRWRDLQNLFENICEQIFRSRRLDALILNYRTGSFRQRQKWMDSDDIRFLIAVGLRLLIEISWQKRVLVLGVAKDSSANYLFRNFLSVMAVSGFMEVPENLNLPNTDRLVAEMFPLVDPELVAPWSTIEYDSVFMTLRAQYSSDSQTPIVQGVRGDILAPSDGLFVRCLIHLFLKRRPRKRSPLMGHVLFMDRLVYPNYDKIHRVREPITTRGSKIYPLLWTDKDEPNPLQDVSVLVADILTRNLFPEAVGQPDPLHRADMGAKSLGHRIQALMDESVRRLRMNPLAWNFRNHRDRR